MKLLPTKEEYDRLVIFRTQSTYNEYEKNEMIGLAVKFLHPSLTQNLGGSCSSCGKTDWMRQMKNNLFSWFIANKEEIEASFVSPPPLES